MSRDAAAIEPALQAWRKNGPISLQIASRQDGGARGQLLETTRIERACHDCRC
jgi:hypothetical protein